MKIKENDTVRLKEINEHFEALEAIMSKLSPETLDALNTFHDESFSISYCVKWGATGIAEVLEAVKAEN
ncbi:MAG: hypothetical protein KH501_02950 [Eubacterium limosum]|nr:hypothetical protein [Eubacterium limosum]